MTNHNVDLKLSPAVLLDLERWRGHLPLRIGEGGVQIEHCLHGPSQSGNPLEVHGCTIMAESAEGNNVRLTFLTMCPMSSLFRPRRYRYHLWDWVSVACNN